MDEQQKPPVSGTYLYQNSTGTIMEVAQDQIETAVRSGLYSPKKDAQFVVFDPYGERHVVEGAYLDQVLKDGFTLENSQDRSSRELQEQYGGPVEQVAAAGAGALRGASLGLTDVAASTNPELQTYLQKIKEANPGASMAGEVVGTAGATLLAPETLAGRVLGAGVRGAEAVGVKAGQFAAKTLAKEGVKAGLGRKTAETVASKMIQYGAEGGVIAAGQLVSESALGNADFNAENLAMSVGTGALIGGAFGSAVGIGKAVSPVLKKAAQPLIDTVESFTNREKAAADVVGWSAVKAAKIKEKNPGLFRDLPDFLTETGLKAGDDAEAILAKVESVQQQSGKRLGEQIDRYDKLLAENPDLVPDKKILFKELASQIDEKFMSLKAGTPESRAALKAAGNYYDELIKSSFEGGQFTLRGLQEARQSAYKLGKATSNSLEGKMAKEAARFYSNTLKNVAEQLSERTGTQDIFSAFLKDHKTYSYASEILPDLIKKSVKKESLNSLTTSVLGAAAGGVLGEGDFGSLSAGALAGLGARSLLKSDILKNLIVMGKIEASQQAVKKAITSAIKSYESAKPSGARALKYANLSVANSVLGQKYEDGKYKKAKSSAEAYTNVVENLRRYQANPEQFLQRVNRNSSLIYSSAPQTSGQLDALAVRGVNFLASKIPSKAAQPGVLGMFKKDVPPSKIDLAKFERYLTAVEEPAKVFDAISEGRLSREHIEAIQIVYPNIYEKLQEAALEFVGSNPKLDYNKKLQLGVLLNVPTDESLLPQNIMGLQSNFAAQGPEQAQGAVSQTVGGMGKVNKSDRLATSSESTAKRLNS